MKLKLKSLLLDFFLQVTLPFCRIPWVLLVLRHVCYQRRRALRRVLEARLRAAGDYGDDVQRGPFAGLKYLPPERYASFRFEKIIGAYEHELHDWLGELSRTRNYATILNIGAAEGYFTAGLARLFPGAHVLSWETEAENRNYCSDLLSLNGLSDRVTIHGFCTLGDLKALDPAGPVLVMMDVDVGERLLLDPAQVPWLRRADVLVETHDCLPGGEGICQLMKDRFGSSHAIRQVTSTGLRYTDYPLLRPLLFEEIHALVGEDRPGMQDWLLMQPLTPGS